MESNKIRSFRDLIVWQESHKLVILVYEITKFFPREEMFGLVSQMRRAAVSISSNIAEGFVRNTKPEKMQFYSIAKGSLTELECQVLISKDLKYLDLTTFEKAENLINAVHRLINAFIKSLKTNNLSFAKYQIPNTKYQSGQSLIETIGAIFILTMALTTAVGVAVYALSRSAVSQHEIVAVNLAREGIDVIKAMRDSNWLASDVSSDPTFNLQSCGDIAGRFCYPKAYSGPSYNLTAGNHRILFDSATGIWTIDSATGYYLFLLANGSYTSTVTSLSTNFARMVNISFNSSAPYTNQNSNQELIVKSVVAWKDKNCTAFNTDQDLLTLSTPCKVVTEEHLTNWKDYK